MPFQNLKNVYALISINRDDVFTIAESSDYHEAIAELTAWAIANNHRIAKSEVDDAATCVVKAMPLLTR